MGNAYDASVKLHGEREPLQEGKPLTIGWAEEDITPPGPVLLTGLFHARLSEGIQDPLTATAWALESGKEQAVWVSCDLIHISDELLGAVRGRLQDQAADLDPLKVVMNATHTHTAPPVGKHVSAADHLPGGRSGAELEAMSIAEYVSWAAERIARAAARAWSTRTPGGIGFGEGTAIVGRNRRWVNAAGRTTMYSSDAQDKQRRTAKTMTYDKSFYQVDAESEHAFRHIEGYEDHSVQLLATYDAYGKLTGLVTNVPCPAQEGEDGFAVSADWWHETRGELRRRFGESLFILPQCSAAGDISPHLLYEATAHARMLALKGRTEREEIACRIADAASDILPYIHQAIDWNPTLGHSVETVALQANVLTEEEAREAENEAERWKEQWEKERRRLEDDPELLQLPRWYVDLTYAYGRMHAMQGIVHRFRNQHSRSAYSTEIHVVRLGDVAFATQPFECYLDFGVQIKVRSPAVQTFLIQLAGGGTYLPSPRSVRGGGYGSTAASNPVGPEGGQQLVEFTAQKLLSMWE
ncbi:MAG: hypothetical protein K0R28_6 [Paenibacillus sp.]|nr:hypothetical protein [Paenibacillus sp.]